MKNGKRFILVLSLSIIFSNKLYCQDYINIGITHDFTKGPLLQTFSCDFNQTESVGAKTGKSLIYTSNNFYITPTSSVNIGDGTTSSPNNVLFQIFAGKAWVGDEHTDKLTISNWDNAIELNPSFNSDKNFIEKLGYGQLKLLTTYKTHTVTSHDISTHPFTKSEFTISPGAFTNFGSRFSKTYNTEHFYSTAGILLDLTYRVAKQDTSYKAYDNWIFGLTGNYYYIVSEVEKLTSDKYAESLNISITKRIYNTIYLGLTYKYGNDNPTYTLINTLGLTFKIKY